MSNPEKETKRYAKYMASLPKPLTDGPKPGSTKIKLLKWDDCKGCEKRVRRGERAVWDRGPWCMECAKESGWAPKKKNKKRESNDTRQPYKARR